MEKITSGKAGAGYMGIWDIPGCLDALKKNVPDAQFVSAAFPSGKDGQGGRICFQWVTPAYMEYRRYPKMRSR